MVRLTSMPSSEVIFISCSQARIARPSEVFVTSQVNSANSDIVTTVITICIQESCTTKPFSSKILNPPGISSGKFLSRAPWATWAKFCNAMDMPIAEISGAKRNEPRNGR